MTGANRLPPPYGLLIDRDSPVHFRFEGQSVAGLSGDTIASALAANGRWILSRSFKYHRPRGILSMAGQDANTLVQLPSDPNSLADRVRVVDGLDVRGQNYRGRLERDRDAIIGRFARFLPVGFYYKAFFRPAGIWNLWSRLFRRKAGLGIIDPDFVPTAYEKQYRFCDVAVVGGGVAGMTAALQAAAAGAEVILIDENPALGGALNYGRIDPAGERSRSLRTELVRAVEADARIEIMTDATVNGWFADNWLAVIAARRLSKLRAAQVILCTGTLGQHAVFHNNDLPGVMLASAAARLVHLYGVRPGRRAVVLTANDDGYAAAMDLLDAGVELGAVVELRQQPGDEGLTRALRERGIPIMSRSAVYAAQAAAGGRHLASVDIREIVAKGRCAPAGRRIDCDLLCMSVGVMPAYQLACQAGGSLDYDDANASFKITNLPPSVSLAGAVNGRYSLDAAIDDARRAARLATNALGRSRFDVAAPDPAASLLPAINFDSPIFRHPEGKEFVDFDEDLQIADIVNATRDGYDHIQLVKRYSTCGMGPSQGRHSALAAARLVADATGRSVAETGVTTARPPFAAERLAHCAGRSFYPLRLSSLHYRHLEAGAQMLQAGNWHRPAFYGSAGQRHASILAEVMQVRTNVGIVDVSTLGGIDVRGPDSAEFLNRIYTSRFTTQPAGKARYALMTNEAGVVIDDGVACRLGDEHFYVTATTGGVGHAVQAMLRWNARWRLDVDIANVTSAYCAMNVAGPAARTVLQRACDVDLSAAAFPYMGVREGDVAGIRARVIRVGFVGELGYEIHAPQHCGEALWDALMKAGATEGIRAFGIEAQRLLRLEKGHVIIGQDTDAMSNPMELGMGWALARSKAFFVGKRSIEVLESGRAKRTLAGFEVPDQHAPVPEEGHLVLDGDEMIGRVTSSAYSPTLDKAIGLAYVPPERAGAGSRIDILATGDVIVPARVVSLPFYDPDNTRQSL